MSYVQILARALAICSDTLLISSKSIKEAHAQAHLPMSLTGLHRSSERLSLPLMRNQWQGNGLKVSATRCFKEMPLFPKETHSHCVSSWMRIDIPTGNVIDRRAHDVCLTGMHDRPTNVRI